MPKVFISDPVGKAESVVLSEAGSRRAKALFEKLFCTPEVPADHLKSQI